MKTTVKHIAFIMDGNGRWANSRGLSRSEGHRKGGQTMRRIVDACFARGIEIVSLYAFSTENWQRPKEEVDALFDIIRDYLTDGIPNAKKRNIQLRFMGDVSEFPDDLRTMLVDALDKTGSCTGGCLNLGINYGSRQELLRAVNMILDSGLKKIDAATLERFLYTYGLPDPDLIVRTSGEVRLSNFMLYQAAYSEMFFSGTLWPDFSVRELDSILDDFAHRHRRFGK